MRRPVDSPYRITTRFGLVPGYPLNNGFHSGVDYVTENRRVYATEAGTIIAGKDDRNGLYLVLKGATGTWTYSHMSRRYVQTGAVKEGQYLGQMGDTGLANGVHLHLSLRQKDLVNPEQYFKEDDMYKGQNAEYWYKAFEVYKEKDIKAREALEALRERNRELAGQVATLQEKVAQLEEQLGNTPPTDPDSVTITKDGLWTWFKNLFGGSK